MIQQSFSSMRKEVYKDRPGFAKWNLVDLKGEEMWSSICYGKGIFVSVAVSGSDRIQRTRDGYYWSGVSIPLSTWKGICYGKDKFVIVSYEGEIMTSEDSKNWVSQTVPVTIPLVDVIYGKNSFKALSENGRILESIDGITWTEIDLSNISSSLIGSKFIDMIYGGGSFVCISREGNKSIFTDSNGTWISQEIASNKWSSITYGKGKYVAVAHGPSVIEGEDQDTPRIGIRNMSGAWKYIEGVPDLKYTTVSYGDGVFVAYGEEGVIVSEDGENWIQDRKIIKRDYSCSTYGNGIHIGLSLTAPSFESKGIMSGNGPINIEELSLEI